MEHESPIMKAWREFGLADPGNCDREWEAYLALVNKTTTSSVSPPTNTTPPLHNRVLGPAVVSSSSTTCSTASLNTPSSAISSTAVSEESASRWDRDDVYPPLAELRRALMIDAEWAAMSEWEKDLWEMKHLPEKERMNNIDGIVMWLPAAQREKRRKELLEEVLRFGEPAPTIDSSKALAPTTSNISTRLPGELELDDPVTPTPATCLAECPCKDAPAPVSVIIPSTTSISSTIIYDVVPEQAAPEVLDVDAMGDTTISAVVCLPAGPDHNMCGENLVSKSQTLWSAPTSFSLLLGNLPTSMCEPIDVLEPFMGSSTSCPTIRSGRSLDTPPSLMSEAYMEFCIGPNGVTFVPWPPPSWNRAITPLIRDQDLYQHAIQNCGNEFSVMDSKGNWNAIWLRVEQKPPWLFLGVCMNLPLTLLTQIGVLSLQTRINCPPWPPPWSPCIQNIHQLGVHDMPPLLILLVESMEYIRGRIEIRFCCFSSQVAELFLFCCAAYSSPNMYCTMDATNISEDWLYSTTMELQWGATLTVITFDLGVQCVPLQPIVFKWSDHFCYDTSYVLATCQSMFSDVEVQSLVHAEREGWFQFCSTQKASLYIYGTVLFQWEISGPPTTLIMRITMLWQVERKWKFKERIEVVKVQLRWPPPVWLNLTIFTAWYMFCARANFYSTFRNTKRFLGVDTNSHNSQNSINLDFQQVTNPCHSLPSARPPDCATCILLLAPGWLFVLPCEVLAVPTYLMVQLIACCSRDKSFMKSVYPSGYAWRQMDISSLQDIIGSCFNGYLNPYGFELLQWKIAWPVDMECSSSLTTVGYDSYHNGRNSAFPLVSARNIQSSILHLLGVESACVATCHDSKLYSYFNFERKLMQDQTATEVTDVRWNSTHLPLPHLTWDPGGYVHHRLEGKPIFKEGGLSTTCLSSWMVGCDLGPWPASK